jgi:FemAB-related protein (PEP-CTERM system-associated)
MIQLKPLRIGLHRSLSPWSTEIKYVFRTLLRIAGLPYQFLWADSTNKDENYDICYAPRGESVSAEIKIFASGRSFAEMVALEPMGLVSDHGIEFLIFSKGQEGKLVHDAGCLVIENDIIFSCYWLLTGAFEPRYRCDRLDNLDLDGSFFLNNELNSKPLVSIYGNLLRQHFEQRGWETLRFPWAPSNIGVAFVLSHDVDYPEIIRSIECLRLLANRGIGGLRSVADVLTGKSHFWKFADWVDFEKEIGTRPAFYFMARQGSLLQYAMGTPDGFYDIRSRKFQELFTYLKNEGCEIGLHASYRCNENPEKLKNEKLVLEEAAATEVYGNRHHYWHLDPAAPHETLQFHEKAGFLYDSSLGFEFYPGFRRGICHPFRVFHPDLRRELQVIQLPPTWMDDHFDRRLGKNGIRDSQAHAKRLAGIAEATGGVVTVDYHARGMNDDFYPRYGAFLREFLRTYATGSVKFQTPKATALQYLEYETKLEALSKDSTALTTMPIDSRGNVVDSQGSISVGLQNEEEAEAWDAFVESHPDGTIYHTQAWRRVTEEGFGHRAYYLRALDERGHFVGILPLFLVQGLFGRRLVSVPMRDRGAVLSTDQKTESLLICQAIDLSRELRCKYLELRSLHRMSPETVEERNLHCRQEWITTRIDLSPGVERLWKNLDKDFVRWAINKARKQGVTVELDATERGINLFYELFAKTRRKMGIPPFRKRLFESIWRTLIQEERANLFLVWKDSEPIHGMINFFSKDTFIPAYAAPQNQWRKSYPNEVMIWHTIAWATERGFRFYDFGSDSPRQTGLLRFKKKWGGVQQLMFYYYFTNEHAKVPHFDSSADSYSVLRKAWTLLPAPVCKIAGGWVTRQLS